MEDTPEETVLVADDDAGMRLLARRWLEQEGFRVVEAADGQEAIEAFFRRPANIVVTDLEMPRQDGLQLTAAIKRGGPPAWVVLMTGSNEEGIEDRVRRGGVDCFLRKPVSRAALLAAIEGRRRARRSPIG